MPLPHQCIECDKPLPIHGLCPECQNKLTYDSSYQSKRCFSMLIGKYPNCKTKFYVIKK